MNESFYQMITDAITAIAIEHGIIVTALACFGLIALINGAMQKAAPVIELIGYGLIITPIIILKTIFDKDSRLGIKSDVGEIIKYLKENPKIGIWSAIYLIVIVSIIIYILYINLVGMTSDVNLFANSTVDVINETVINPVNV